MDEGDAKVYPLACDLAGSAGACGDCKMTPMIPPNAKKLELLYDSQTLAVLGINLPAGSTVPLRETHLLGILEAAKVRVNEFISQQKEQAMQVQLAPAHAGMTLEELKALESGNGGS